MIGIFGWLILFVWAFFLVPMIPVMRSRWLERQGVGRYVRTWPLVTVIVPARNEGAKLEAGLRSLLASDYPALEIIAVNDRSTDETGRIMDQLAAGDARLRVIHIAELPPGWLGKNHAMHAAGSAAVGDWLLFTDGDVLFRPATIRLAMGFALTGGSRPGSGTPSIDFLTIVPQMVGGGYFERVMCAFFGFVLLATVQPFLVASRWPFAYCGVGAFNLVRRGAWRAVGGHVRIRLDVLDDVHLGKLMKYTGHRCELLLGGDHLRVRWQDSLWGVVRGLEKNGFASINYSLFSMTWASALIMTCVLGPYVGIALTRGWEQTPFIASALYVHGMLAWQAHRFAAGWQVTLALPAGCLLFLFAYWRSAWITLRQGGVRWRDTFYPLADLRANRLNV